MKKLFLFLIAVLPQLDAFAQDFRYGVKGGVTYSDISGSDLEDEEHKYKLGWHAGVMVNIKKPASEYFSIQPELIYSRKGYENSSKPFEVRDNNNNLQYSAQQGGIVYLNYLDLPLMLNFKKKFIVFEIGPQFSYLVGYHDNSFLRQTFADGTEQIVPLESFQDIRSIDLGIATGFRLESESGVGFGLRFNQGFIKLPSETNDVSLPPPGFNQYFQLFASYLLPK